MRQGDIKATATRTRRWLADRVWPRLFEFLAWAAPIVIRLRWRILFIFAGVLLPLVAFGELVNEVFVKRGLPWDAGALTFIHERLGGPVMDRLMVTITDVGRVPSMLAAMALVAGILIGSGRKRDAMFFITSYLVC